MGDVVNFPKNLGNICQLKAEADNLVEDCCKHSKKVVQPTLFCKTCATLEICEDCLQQDHSESTCEILPFEPFKNMLNRCYDIYKRQIDKNSQSLKELLQLVKEYRLSSIAQIEEEFCDIEAKVYEFYSKKCEMVGECVESLNIASINEDDFEKIFEKLSKNEMIMKETPKVSIEYKLSTGEVDSCSVRFKQRSEESQQANTSLKNVSEFSLVLEPGPVGYNLEPNLFGAYPILHKNGQLNGNPRISSTENEITNHESNSSNIAQFDKRLIKLNSMETINPSSLEVGGSGFFYLDTFNNPNNSNHIFFRTFGNLPELEIELNKHISKFVMTFNFIYALSSDEGFLLTSQKPLGRSVKFTVVSEKRYVSLRAYEPGVFQRYVSARDEEGNLYLFLNDKLRWKIHQALLLDISMKCNGDLIVRNETENTVSILDKSTGDSKKSYKIDNLEDIREFQPHGYLVLCQDSCDEKYLYLYDEKFERREKLMACLKILGTSINRFICLTSSEICLFTIK
ncbi:unnamed protein product [Dimorphilus gyrociliatus]|uniref:Uncharacterized protein n=1 Tax=Dimorphilus gyrociliatus TaxID=2664684 RepID=A0A7I8VGU0_9ANNE|nr:unnamed protein product [Dimorphilus gyrociliatus]